MKKNVKKATKKAKEIKKISEEAPKKVEKTTTRIFEHDGKTYEKTYDAKGGSLSIKEIK